MKSAFVIGYDKKGDPIGVVEGEGYTIIEKDAEHTTGLIEKVKKHLDSTEGPVAEGFPIEVKSNHILHIGSKSCHVVYIAGRCYVICG